MREIRLHPKPLLSVLIPHLPERKDKLNRLLNQIVQQVKGLAVEILIDDSDKTTGEKRNSLLKAANGVFVNYLDDDDEIADNYFEKIFPYLNDKTDTIGFVMDFQAGSFSMPMVCCAAVAERKAYSGIMFCPITPIQVTRKSLCAPFPPITKGEDIIWSREMYPILKNSKSRFINEILYIYNGHGQGK